MLKTLKNLGFEIVREKEHISMIRINIDGTKTPLTLPNHSIINGAILRLICSQAGISREDFINAYERKLIKNKIDLLEPQLIELFKISLISLIFFFYSTK